MPLATESEVKGYYEGQSTAEQYVRNRFANEVHRLLHDRQVATVQGVFDRVRPQRTLEVAPGPGRVTRDLRPTGELVCLEYNEGMIEQGRAACGDRARWIRGDAFQLPFLDEFDFVYTFRFIRHFHRADRDRLYSGIRRVLKPGGRLIFDAVNARISAPLRAAHPDEYPVYDQLYSEDELRQELLAAGFSGIDLAPVQKRFGWQSRCQNLLGPRANWLNRGVIRALENLPARDGLEWIVTCRRE